MIQRHLSTNHVIELSKQEDLQLRRVFETLCGFATSEHNEHKPVDTAPLSLTIESHSKQQVAVPELTGLVSAADVSAILTKINHPQTKAQVDLMIWEVDENLDGFVDWEELQLTYYRNITDTSRLEPFRLFYLIQFLVFDKDLTGVISLDDAMPLLFARLGKTKMEAYLDWIFGGTNIINGSENTRTSFSEYISRVCVRSADV